MTFLQCMNSVHPTIKSTSGWSYHNVNFLGVTVMLNNGMLSTDLFTKPRDKHQKLYHTSCQAGSCKKRIPYSQALMLRRICSQEKDFEQRSQVLCNVLKLQECDRGFLEREIGRTLHIQREDNTYVIIAGPQE